MKEWRDAVKELKSYIMALLITGITVLAYAEGLSTMAEVGKSQESMQKVLDQETKNYEAVKKAIEKGEIKKGTFQDMIKKRYGEPVVILPDKRHAEKWVYKPGHFSWFEGPKIYLFFDNNGELKGINQKAK